MTALPQAVTPTSRTLRRVMKGDLCTGCGLCAGLAPAAITMSEAAPGYHRPRQTGPIDPATEQILAEACPGSKVAAWRPVPSPHPLWGPVISCRTGHSTDPEIRFTGSSGGALTALALFALESGQVDAVVHITADPDQPTGNITSVSRDRSGLLAGAGSRYAPSSPLERIQELVATGERHLFIGKPCDVSALRQLTMLSPAVARAVPIMLSFFCAAVPSLAGSRRIVEAMGLDSEGLRAFRYRGHGWPGLTVADSASGRQASMRYEQSWGEILSKEIQYRCKICPDGVGGSADIAAADAWYGSERGYPMFEEQDGRSLILARSLLGQELLDAAVAAGALETRPEPLSSIAAMQPSQARRKRQLAARLAAARALGQPVPDASGVATRQAARLAGWAEKLRTFAGSARRILADNR